MVANSEDTQNGQPRAKAEKEILRHVVTTKIATPEKGKI